MMVVLHIDNRIFGIRLLRYPANRYKTLMLIKVELYRTCISSEITCSLKDKLKVIKHTLEPWNCKYVNMHLNLLLRYQDASSFLVIG